MSLDQSVSYVAILIAGAIGAAPVLAQAPAVSPGMQVVDASGSPVGVIESLKGTEVVLKTDKHEVELPTSSFTPSGGKLLFGMTQAQVDTAAEQAVDEAQKAIAPGVQVYGQGGTLAGTIDSIDDQYATIKLTSGELIRVPKAGVASENGKVIVGTSVAQLKSDANQASTAPKKDGSGG